MLELRTREVAVWVDSRLRSRIIEDRGFSCPHPNSSFFSESFEIEVKWKESGLNDWTDRYQRLCLRKAHHHHWVRPAVRTSGASIPYTPLSMHTSAMQKNFAFAKMALEYSAIIFAVVESGNGVITPARATKTVPYSGYEFTGTCFAIIRIVRVCAEPADEWTLLRASNEVCGTKIEENA